MTASFEAVDLAQYTTELACMFDSAVTRAGLEFRIDADPLPEPAYVDREMWAKIVLNLLSNALKFTFNGSITVALDAARRPRAPARDGHRHRDRAGRAGEAVRALPPGARRPLAHP